MKPYGVEKVFVEALSLTGGQKKRRTSFTPAMRILAF